MTPKFLLAVLSITIVNEKVPTAERGNSIAGLRSMGLVSTSAKRKVTCQITLEYLQQYCRILNVLNTSFIIMTHSKNIPEFPIIFGMYSICYLSLIPPHEYFMRLGTRTRHGSRSRASNLIGGRRLEARHQLPSSSYGPN